MAAITYITRLTRAYCFMRRPRCPAPKIYALILFSGPIIGEGGRILQFVPALQLPQSESPGCRRNRGGMRPIFTVGESEFLAEGALQMTSRRNETGPERAFENSN